MDGINLPLTRREIDDLLQGEVLTVAVPDVADPTGPPVVTVFVRLAE